MKSVFADTFYWIALFNPKDEYYERARKVSADLTTIRIVTTDEVLTEFLAFFASLGPQGREVAVKYVRRILSNPNVQVIPQTRESFLAGLKLYEDRLDKDYSATDCVSMETMREQKLTDILTHDNHFAQEQFVVLIQ